MWLDCPAVIVIVIDRKVKVLVVGAGLTGCLTSYLLREQCGDSIDLKVMERSAYPSGRFGAGLRCEGKWADMGSQVIGRDLVAQNLKMVSRSCLLSTAMVTTLTPARTDTGCLPRTSFRHHFVLCLSVCVITLTKETMNQQENFSGLEISEALDQIRGDCPGSQRWS